MTFERCDAVVADPAFVGIAIKPTDLGGRGMHVGLLYRHSNGEVRFAHLEWHHRLKNDAAPSGGEYLWAECESLMQDNSLSDFVANFIELCAQTREIPYGPNPPADAFDPSGRYTPQDRREGLTCATYISSVFQGAGFPVAHLETWESRPDDAAWWKPIQELLEDYAPARAAELIDIAIDFRLRPDEVAVAATSIDAPLVFHDAVERSIPLQALLFPAQPPATGQPAGVAPPENAFAQK